MTVLHYWSNPAAEEVAPGAIEFLEALPGPTHIFIPGRDPSRCRVVVSLLHGNEPSGFMAIHALLRQQIRPAVDIHFFIASVAAARTRPLFFYRMLPGERDLNRCFRPPFDDNAQSQLAKAILDILHALKPEAIVDVHNTSGAGPSFGVAVYMDAQHEALTSLFTHRLVITDLVLGSVMELTETLCPTVTIECGGAKDDESDRVALIGMTQFVGLEDVLNLAPDNVAMEFFRNPLRLELQQGAAISYGMHALPIKGVNLLPDVEHLNFNFVEPGTPLGFVTGEVDTVLRARSNTGEDTVLQYFLVQDNQLLTRQRMKFFMVTNNPEIARTDCLLYFVPVQTGPEAAIPGSSS
jgi:hypothetical protein